MNNTLSLASGSLKAVIRLLGLLAALVVTGTLTTAAAQAADQPIVFADCPLPGRCNINTNIDLINPDGTGLATIGYGVMPQLSPGGQQVAYSFANVSSCLSNHPFSNNRYDIYTMNRDGSGAKNLTAGLPCSNSIAPAWSPDGTKIAFQHTPDLAGPRGVFVMNADGSNPTPIAAGYAPSWSPDGRKILYTAFAGAQFHTVNPDGTGDTNLGILNGAPSTGTGGFWAPDGASIAYIGNGTAGGCGTYCLRRMNPDGSNAATFYSSPFGSQITSASWSPDGTQMALCMYVPNPAGNAALYTINASGGPATQFYSNVVGPGCENVHWQAVKPKDTTPPVLTLPATVTANATTAAGASVSYTVSASDPDNTTAELAISCTPASGTTFAIGTTAVNCTASDPAGNTASGTFNVVVKGASEQLSDLTDLIDSFGLPTGAETSLTALVQKTLAALEAGDTTTALNTLRAFTNLVKAQTGKSLTQAEADQLLAYANRLAGLI